jgi:hypothetical protein
MRVGSSRPVDKEGHAPYHSHNDIVIVSEAHAWQPPGGLLQYGDRTTLLVTRFAIVIIEGALYLK